MQLAPKPILRANWQCVPGTFDAPTITSEQVKDFGLFMMRAVLSRRGDEIIDLARVNLLR